MGDAPEGFTLVDFEGEPVYVTTLPRGTVLYRGVDKLGTITEDTFGVRTPTGFCLPPNYNVFFYPFPFVDSTIKEYSHFLVYVVANDIKLATFIAPSPAIRGDRHQGVGPIVSCGSLSQSEHGCAVRGRDYDPCFKPAFRLAHPEISGMIGMPEMDQAAFMKAVKNYRTPTGIRKHLNTYLTTYEDALGVPGVPELILYPFTSRLAEDLHTPMARTLPDWFAAHRTTLGYALWKTIPRTDEAILEFLEEATGPEAGESRMMLDTRTGFYVVRRKASLETRAHLVEVRVGEEWSMTKHADTFRFKRGDVTIPYATKDQLLARTAALGETLTAAVRTNSVVDGKPKSKYPDRMAHVLAEVALYPMFVALGFHIVPEGNSELGDFSYGPEKPAEETPSMYDAIVTGALEALPAEDASKTLPETTDPRYGNTLDGELHYPPMDPYDVTSPVLTLYPRLHATLSESLLRRAYTKATDTFDVSPMIETAATLTADLLRRAMESNYTALCAKESDTAASAQPCPHAAEVSLHNLEAVSELLTQKDYDYGADDGWVNFSFALRMSPASDHRWGDWTDEDVDWGGEEVGGRRRRTHRLRRVSRRRRRYVRRRRAPTAA